MKDVVFTIVVIVGCLLLFRACKACDNMQSPGSKGTDTLSHKIDTIWLSQKSDTVYIPEIIGVTNTIRETNWVHDTLETFEVRIDPADTAAILKRYYQKVAYSDTQNIQYGNIVINDTVTQNRIVSRGLELNQSLPLVKEITILLKERNQIWIGANAMTDLGKLYIGSELMLKTKSNIAYSGGVMIGQDGKPLYTGGVKVLIRLRKPR